MTNPFDGLKPISSYSRADALRDGVLVDVSEVARLAGFRFPVAVTHAVWDGFLDKRGPEFREGRLWDLLF